MSFTYNSHIPSQTDYHWSGPSPIPNDSTVNHHLNLIESNDSEWMTFWIISWSENLPASAKLRKSLKHQPLSSGPVCLNADSRGGVSEKCCVSWRNYLSNMAPTSALCALCIQSQCVITMSLHSYIVITEYCLLSDPFSRTLCLHMIYKLFSDTFKTVFNCILRVCWLYVWTQFTLSCTCTLTMWSYLRHNYIHMY